MLRPLCFFAVVLVVDGLTGCGGAEEPSVAATHRCLTRVFKRYHHPWGRGSCRIVTLERTGTNRFTGTVEFLDGTQEPLTVYFEGRAGGWEGYLHARVTKGFRGAFGGPSFEDRHPILCLCAFGAVVMLMAFSFIYPSLILFGLRRRNSWRLEWMLALSALASPWMGVLLYLRFIESWKNMCSA